MGNEGSRPDSSPLLISYRLGHGQDDLESRAGLFGETSVAPPSFQLSLATSVAALKHAAVHDAEFAADFLAIRFK